MFRRIFLIVIFSFPALLWAAQPARVEVDQAQIYASPSLQGEVLAEIKRGDRVAAANLPIAGYYKVRTTEGIVGWVSAEVLVLERGGRSGESLAAQRAGYSFMDEDLLHPRKKRVRFRLLGGADMFTLTEISNQLGFGTLSNGMYYGGEFQVRLSHYLLLLIRLENVKKSLNAQDDATNRDYQIDVSSLPISAGLGIEFALGESLSFQMNGLAGVGVSTEFKSTSLDESTPNETVLSSQPFTWIAQVSLNYHLSETIIFLLEAGYRSLLTSKLTPTQSVNGSELFKTSGSFVPLPINLSGTFFGAGLAFYL